MSSASSYGGFASQAIRSAHDATQSDSEEEADAYEIEEMGPPPGTVGPVEHVDLDVRMDRLPPGQSYNPNNSNPPAGMMSGVRPTGNGLPSANTGPKGVLEDFKEAVRNSTNIHLREKIQRELAMEEHAVSGLVSTAAQQPHHKPQEGKSNEPQEDEADSDDEEAIAKWKAARLATLSALQSSLPVFGTFDRVDFAGFASIVKSTHAMCFVVVHLYENDNADCIRLNFCLETLAARHRHVKFIRIRSVEAINNYNPVGLPSLIFYKGGEQVDSLVRVCDHLPKGFLSSDVETLLHNKYHVLGAPSGENELRKKEEEDDKREKKRAVRLQPKAVKDVDSDDD